jgi:hypothetical protein
MEEIYLLLDERFSQIEEIQKKHNKIIQSLDDPPQGQPINMSEVQELSHTMLQMKRNDKLRLIKENELMEIVFSLRSFDDQQRL